LSIEYYCKEKIKFKDETQHNSPLVSTDRLQRMIDKGVMGAVVQLNPIRPPGINKMSTPTEPEISKILQEYAEIFEEPKELPPPRDCDHAIPLHPGTKPVNIRPYRLPHYQKDAMEDIIE
jgi:hypothetical protein